jgi:hypothetical protein
MKTKNDLQRAKQKLLARIDRNTRFRMKLAKQYPLDVRNRHSSSCLYQFYEYINGLSRTHPIFTKIQVMSDEEIKLLEFRLSRYGFGTEEPDPERFLCELLIANYSDRIKL